MLQNKNFKTNDRINTRNLQIKAAAMHGRYSSVCLSAPVAQWEPMRKRSESPGQAEWRQTDTGRASFPQDTQKQSQFRLTQLNLYS